MKPAAPRKMRKTKRPKVTARRLAFAFALAYAAAVYIVSPVYLPLLDSATYSDIAYNLASGRGYLLGGSPAGDVPLLPVVLAGFMLMFGGAWIPAYLAVASFLLVVSLFYLAEELRKGSGLVSVLLLPTLALPVLLTLQVLTDVLFLAVVNAGIVMLRRFARKPGWKNAAPFCVLVAASYLLRPSGLFFMAFCGIVLGWGFMQKRIPLQKLALFVLVAALAVGGWELAGGKIAAIGESAAKPDTASIAFSLSDHYNGEISFSAGVPMQAGNAVRLVVLLLVFVMPAMLYVFVKGLWDPAMKKDAEALFLLLWLAVFLLPHVTVIPSLVARYIMPVLPVFVVVFADFIRNEKRRLLVVALIAVHLSAGMASYFWYYPRTEHLTTRVFEEGGEWIRGLPEGAPIAVSGMGAAEVHYYSGRLPTSDTPDGADYIMRSNLYDATISVEGFTLCRRFEDRFYRLEVWGRRC